MDALLALVGNVDPAALAVMLYIAWRLDRRMLVMQSEIEKLWQVVPKRKSDGGETDV